MIDSEARERFFLEQEEMLLQGGVAFSEWCTFISKSVYDAFINGADLAVIITAVACIETYLKTENPENKNKKLIQLINEDTFLTETEKRDLHILRKYRNGWVHANRLDTNGKLIYLDDTDILENEEKYLSELEEMAFLAVKMLLTVLFSNQST